MVLYLKDKFIPTFYTGTSFEDKVEESVKMMFENYKRTSPLASFYWFLFLFFSLDIYLYYFTIIFGKCTSICTLPLLLYYSRDRPYPNTVGTVVTLDCIQMFVWHCVLVVYKEVPSISLFAGPLYGIHLEKRTKILSSILTSVFVLYL